MAAVARCGGMRAVLAPVLALLPLAACGEPRSAGSSEEPKAGSQPQSRSPAGKGVAMRSGPEVPVALPRGFSLYPGAKVVSNTVVGDGAARRALLVLETPDPLAEVMVFYRGQATAAGLSVSLDIGGDERASLGGRLPSGAIVALSARREGGLTRAELAWE